MPQSSLALATQSKPKTSEGMPLARTMATMVPKATRCVRVQSGRLNAQPVPARAVRTTASGYANRPTGKPNKLNQNTGSRVAEKPINGDKSRLASPATSGLRKVCTAQPRASQNRTIDRVRASGAVCMRPV